MFFCDSCQKYKFYDVFLRVNVTKYRKLHAYLSEREGGQSRATLHWPLGEIARTPSVRH